MTGGSLLRAMKLLYSFADFFLFFLPSEYWAEMAVLLQIKFNCTVSLWKNICFYRVFHLDPRVVQGTLWLWEERKLPCMCCSCLLKDELACWRSKVQSVHSDRVLVFFPLSWSRQGLETKPHVSHYAAFSDPSAVTVARIAASLPKFHSKES